MKGKYQHIGLSPYNKTSTELSRHVRRRRYLRSKQHLYDRWFIEYRQRNLESTIDWLSYRQKRLDQYNKRKKNCKYK